MTFTGREPTFEELVRRQNQDVPPRLLALDPGHTTGWAFFRNGHLHSNGQTHGGATSIRDLLETIKPTHVVMERYVIYAWKLKQHSMSDVPTLQLIGQIKLLCQLYKVPLFEQTAQQAKGFATDDKLKKWAMYFEGDKHGVDAIRHGVVYLLFPKSTVKGKKHKVG